MRASTLLLCLAVAGCAAAWRQPPQAGEDEAAVRQRLGTPTSRYTLGDGGSRLEYATGPFGRQTWMVDVDAGGHVRGARQVLGEASFADVQARSPGLSRDELLLALGRPGERRAGGRAGGEVWSWRYPTNDCLWFQVSVGDDGIVRSGTYGIDPGCDTRGDGRH